MPRRLAGAGAWPAAGPAAAAQAAGPAASAGPVGQAVPAAPAVTYWRRRFVVLAVALATLAVAAWSLSGALNWNKKTSTPGCAGPARPVPAGTYTAYAVDGSLTSAPVTFRLR